MGSIRQIVTGLRTAIVGGLSHLNIDRFPTLREFFMTSGFTARFDQTRGDLGSDHMPINRRGGCWSGHSTDLPIPPAMPRHLPQAYEYALISTYLPMHAALALAMVLVGFPTIGRAQPAANRDLMACTRIIVAAERLACFDRAMVARTADAAFPPPVPAAIPSIAAVHPPVQLRVAAGGGFGVGDYYGYFSHLGRGGNLSAASVVGSSGPLVSAQLWIDNWIDPDWTIGLEFLTMNNTGDMRITLPRGVSILTDPIQGTVRASVVTTMGAVNLAWRPVTNLPLRPWIGAGLVGGYGRAAASYSLQSAFLGSSTQTAQAKSAFPALQALLGLDVKFSHSVYLSLLPRIIIASGQPFGLPQRYMDFAFTSLLGVQF
jgi:hypothetical protein